MSRTWKDRPDNIRARKPKGKDRLQAKYSRIFYRKDFSRWNDFETNHLAKNFSYEKKEYLDKDQEEIFYYEISRIMRNGYSKYSFDSVKNIVRDTYDVPMRAYIRTHCVNAVKIANNTDDYEDAQITPKIFNTKGLFRNGWFD